jgi:hypothetical protein
VPHRTFTDAAGRAWQAWEVSPGRALRDEPERRDDGGRRRDTAPGLDPAADERRRPDRRVAVAPALQRGWLAFQAGAERRRLAPVPPGWADAPVAALARYCEAAVPVAPRRTR